jgi:hypothetical protein
MTQSTDNPGAPAAVAAGCTCPIMDNAHGAGAPGSYSHPDGPFFWINSGCPLHGPDLGGVEDDPPPEAATRGQPGDNAV